MKRALPILLLAALVIPSLGAAAQGGEEVLLVRVDGVVTRGTTLQVREAIEEAEERRAPLVIELDTPGGLVEATLNIKKDVARAQIPVLTFVGPRGAFAESAGTFILLMGHPNGMAPNTQIGSAQPIVQNPQGGTQNASDKVQNFLIGQMREIAASTERNQTLAEEFITENRNMNRSEALETGMIDVHAEDVRSFVRAVDGREAIVGDQRVTLDTQDARIVELDKGMLAQLIELISNPQIAFILFLVGMYGVIFGLAAPGTFVPETIGALMLLLGLIGLGLFDTSTAGLLLMLLGTAFFVAEVFTPTHGILTSLGVVSIILAAIFLVDEPLLPAGFLRQFLIVGVVSAVVSGGAVLGAVWIAVRTRSQPPRDVLAGREAEAVTRIDPEGQILLRGERWRARTDGRAIEVDERVEVLERDGLWLTVEPADAEGPIPEEASEPAASDEEDERI